MKTIIVIISFVLAGISNSFYTVETGINNNLNGTCLNNNEDSQLHYATRSDENELINYEKCNNLLSTEMLSSSNCANCLSSTNQDIFVADKTFLYNYYKNLGNNIISNHMGICGYTAIGMFLSYFDTYWDDHFIPENYDSQISNVSSVTYASGKNYQSPGINDTLTSSLSIDSIKEQIEKSGITDDKTIEYKEALDRAIMNVVVEQITENSFAGKLFSIALADNLILPHYTLDSYVKNDDGFFSGDNVANQNEYVEGLGVSYRVVNAVLRDYISQNHYINDGIKIVTSQIKRNVSPEEHLREKARVRGEIIDLVKSGRPVLMGGGGYHDDNNNGIRDVYPKLPDGSEDKRTEKGYGHDVVAYFYDDNNDVLYGNMGWGSDCTLFNLDEFFNEEISDYWCLNILPSLSQKCTANYYFYDNNRYYCPYDHSYMALVSPTDYGFADAYPTDDSTKTDFIDHTLNNDFSFKTRRYRTGYIHNEFIVMSCVKRGIREAFIEYEFDEPVYGIIVDLSYWRSAAHELLNKNNGEAKFKIWGQQDPMNPYDTGGWLTIFDLLSDDVGLPEDRSNIETYTIEFDQPVRNFMFYSKINMLEETDNNRGRICIGNMKIITKRDYAYL